MSKALPKAGRMGPQELPERAGRALHIGPEMGGEIGRAVGDIIPIDKKSSSIHD